MAAATPVEVLEQRRRAIVGHDMDGFADLSAPDAVIDELPFAGPGVPDRLKGQDAIRAFSRASCAPGAR